MTQNQSDPLVNPYARNFLTKFGLPFFACKAEGATITDDKGRVFIDCVAGFGINNLGHNHPKVADAIQEALRKKEQHARPFLNEKQIELARKLAEFSPHELSLLFLCNSGSEAIDSAIKLARLYSGKPGIVAAKGGFHGFTYGALSASGIDVFQRGFDPLVPDILHVPFGDFEAIRDIISDDSGAVLLELMQHESGIKIPAKKYFRQVREFCSEKNILLIIDEIKTGFGKTGYLFACEHFDVTPDILALGKSMSGGFIPIGAILARKKLHRKFNLSFPMSASSYAGNTLACVSALATAQVLFEEKLIENCRSVGLFLLENLKALQDEFKTLIVDVNGLGFLLGIKCTSPRIALFLIRKIIENDVLALPAFGNPSVIMIEPPLCLNMNQAHNVVEAFRIGLESLHKNLSRNKSRIK